MLATVWGPNPESNTLDVTDPKLNHRAKETGGRSNLWLLLLAAAAEGILPPQVGCQSRAVLLRFSPGLALELGLWFAKDVHGWQAEAHSPRQTVKVRWSSASQQSPSRHMQRFRMSFGLGVDAYFGERGFRLSITFNLPEL